MKTQNLHYIWSHCCFVCNTFAMTCNAAHLRFSSPPPCFSILLYPPPPTHTPSSPPPPTSSFSPPAERKRRNKWTTSPYTRKIGNCIGGCFLRVRGVCSLPAVDTLHLFGLTASVRPLWGVFLLSHPNSLLPASLRVAVWTVSAQQQHRRRSARPESTSQTLMDFEKQA